MSQTSGADLPSLYHWTRTGVVEGSWGPYETFESLVFAEPLREQLQKLALGFLGSQDFCAQAKMPWRRGAFLFGPGGSGKSAAGRAIALLLGWQHLSIPAHEILDTHHLTRALMELKRYLPGVVVLENVDQVFRRLDPATFFEIFDHAAERLDGLFWVATSKRPEDVPKSQLIRPGRFEETLRLGPPSAEAKKKFYETYLEPFMIAALGGASETLGPSKLEHLAALEANPELSYAHLQEMRLLIGKVLMDGEPDRLISEFQSFCQEQLIAGDRWGGTAAAEADLAERIRLSDPRLLVSALHVTDAFKSMIEATVSNASEALAAAQNDAG